MPDDPVPGISSSLDAILDILSKGWIGTIVGLAGIVLAVVFYLRSCRRARLACQIDHVTLVGGPGAAFEGEVEIRFAGAVVPRITLSKIVIWNNGDRTISGTDLVERDPLRVEVPAAGRILKHTIVRQPRTVNAWHVDQPSSNRLDLSFDFLDPGDGIRLEVIHSQLGRELDLTGTIRGIPAGLLHAPESSLIFWPILLLIAVSLFCGFLLLINRFDVPDWMPLLLGGLIGIVGYGSAYLINRSGRYPANLELPKHDTNG